MHFGKVGVEVPKWIDFLQRAAQGKWLEGISGGHPVQPSLKRSVPKDCAQMAFEYCQTWRHHKLPGRTVPVLSHLHREKVASYV